MLTIFSVPKPFVGHINILQRNAIKSWVSIQPKPEILLIGDEVGTAEAALEFEVRHIPGVARNSHGTPLISSAFEMAQENSTTAIMCYANCDIIFFGDFVEQVKKINFPTFLLVGQRTNLDVNHDIDFSNQYWRESLRTEALTRGQRGGFAAIDYFVFPRGLYNSIPELAVGRIGWDNWLLWNTKSMGIPIVDATNAIMAIHQNHSYNHFNGGETEFRYGSEAKVNLELAGGWKHYHNIEDADWALCNEGFRRAPLTFWIMLRRLERLITNNTMETKIWSVLGPIFDPSFWPRKIASRLRKRFEQ